MNRPDFLILGFLILLSSAWADDAFSVGEKGFAVGLNGHALHQAPDNQINFSDQIALLKKAHVTIYRFDVSPKPEWDAMDKIVDQLNAHNIAPLPTILPPGNRSVAGTPADAEKEAYDYASVLVKRYKGRIHYWELSNELDVFCILKRGDVLPNGKIYAFGASSGWRPSDFSEQRYPYALATLRGLSRGIREGDSTARLIVDGAGWLHVGFLDRLQQDKLDFDIVGWHWYSDYGDIRKVEGKPLLEHLESYHKPIWITEGNSRVDADNPAAEKKQADYLQSALEDFSGLYPIVQVYCVYTLFDSKKEWVHGGVVHVENSGGHPAIGKTKPAFDVISQFEP